MGEWTAKTGVSLTAYFDQYARDYDRVQPVKIEMYRFYHQLALDLVPFEALPASRRGLYGHGQGPRGALLARSKPSP